jgi:hypothetical protein
LLYQEIAIGFRALTIAAAVAAAVVDAVSFNFTALAMDAIVIAINTGAAVVEGMIINIETHIKNDALSVEKTTGAVVGFDPNTNKFSAASLEELQVT